MDLRYFKISEFDSPDEKGSGEEMQAKVLKSLDNARHWVEVNWNNRGKQRIVFSISSGYRTQLHNKQIGGENNSSHIKGLAVDIRFKSYMQAFVIVISLALHGFFRFGISFRDQFVHADMDNSKNPSVWGYASKGLFSILSKTLNNQEDV